MKQQVLKIAIQKSGRLTEKSLQLLRNCGIDIPAESRKLKASANNFPIELYFLREMMIFQNMFKTGLPI